MSYLGINQIFKTAIAGKIIKGGKEIALEIATETTEWYRLPHNISQQVPRFQRVCEQNIEKIKPGTKRLIMRYVDRSILFSCIAC